MHFKLKSKFENVIIKKIVKKVLITAEWKIYKNQYKMDKVQREYCCQNQ